MKMPSLRELFVNQLKDLYSAENQLVKALPKMARAASTPALQEAITAHLEETRGHVERLQQVAEKLGCKLTGHKCKAMEGLIEEGSEIMEAEGPKAILDAGLVAGAQRVEHYEMAAYGTARTMAELLGEQEVVDLLQQTLDEEKAADEKLTQVVEQEIYPQAQVGQEGEEDEEGEEENSRGKNGRSRGRATAGRR